MECKLLEQYVSALSVTQFRELRPPAKAIYSYGKTLGVVLDRRGQFQTELFIVPGGIDLIEFHTHPNVDSFELPVAGNFDFISGGKHNPYENVVSALKEKASLRVRETDVHGAIWNPEGGAFLSFQHWLNGVPPTSVTVDFALDPTNEYNKMSNLRGKESP